MNKKHNSCIAARDLDPCLPDLQSNLRSFFEFQHPHFYRCVPPARRFIPKSFHYQNPMFPRCRKSLAKLPFQISHIRLTHKASPIRKDRNKVYFRIPELDRVIDLQKRPSVILHLISLIQSQKNQCLLLADLEKEVGFVGKWNLIDVTSKYPAIFRVSRGPGVPSVSLSEKAQQIAALEGEAREKMEPILVKNLRKLLMLSVDCMLPLKKVESISDDLGLPSDFKTVLIPKYPHLFSVKNVEGRDNLCLENWDSSLAVTAREERLAQVGCLAGGDSRKNKISKDGNFSGPFAFRLSYPAGFRPNANYLEGVQKWQQLEFPSPYLNGRRFDIADAEARKRVVGVLHELFSLTMHKKLTSAQVEAFRWELRLPAKLLLFLVKHHGMFYFTNKGARATIFLKEAYDGSNLIDKCPLLAFRERFVALSGRGDTSLCTRIPVWRVSS